MPRPQPPASPASSPEIAKTCSGNTNTRSYAGLRVLLLEDDAFVRDICARTLGKLGFEVKAMSDAEEGLQRLLLGDVDLLITDHHMPRVTGLELIGRLRDEKIDTPCILISGNMPLKAAESVARLGKARTMNKPFSIPDLMAVIDESIKPQGT